MGKRRSRWAIDKDTTSDRGIRQRNHWCQTNRKIEEKMRGRRRLHQNIDRRRNRLLPKASIRGEAQFQTSLPADVQRKEHHADAWLEHFRRYTQNIVNYQVQPLRRSSHCSWKIQPLTGSIHCRQNWRTIYNHYWRTSPHISAKWHSTMSSQMGQYFQRFYVPARRPMTTSLKCRSWRNEYFIYKTKYCTGSSYAVSVRGSRPGRRTERWNHIRCSILEYAKVA